MEQKEGAWPVGCVLWPGEGRWPLAAAMRFRAEWSGVDLQIPDEGVPMRQQSPELVERSDRKLRSLLPCPGVGVCGPLDTLCLSPTDSDRNGSEAGRQSSGRVLLFGFFEVDGGCAVQ